MAQLVYQSCTLHHHSRTATARTGSSHLWMNPYKFCVSCLFFCTFYVTPATIRAKSDRRYTRHEQGAAPGKRLAKHLVEGHRDELTPHQRERDSKTMQVWDYTVKDSETV